MLTSFFGRPLRTGASVISIVNSIASICYVLYFFWEYTNKYDNFKNETTIGSVDFENLYSTSSEEVFNTNITLTFILVGFTSMFANFGLKQATLKNATHKIYLWLLVSYAQFGSTIVMESVVLIKYATNINDLIELILCFSLVDAILVFQLLVIQSYYTEEKLAEETNYSRLCQELTSPNEQQEDEFQSVEL